MWLHLLHKTRHLLGDHDHRATQIIGHCVQVNLGLRFLTSHMHIMFTKTNCYFVMPRSYMPEMKLKQQNLLHNFKSTIKSLETKLTIIDKLDTCITRTNLNSLNGQSDKNYKDIKMNIDKVPSIFCDEIILNYINIIMFCIEFLNNKNLVQKRNKRLRKWNKLFDRAHKRHSESRVSRPEFEFDS